MSSDRKWSVSVQIDGENVLNISSDELCGVKHIAEYRTEILEAADNLIAFIGREPSEVIVPEEAQ